MIEVNDLSYTYAKTTKPAIRGIGFAIEPGEIFGFLGPSGAGKSTTQKVLIGLLQDYQGRATVRGKEIHDWAPGDYERIGVSFETPNHFQKLTAVENLKYFGALYSGPVRAPQECLAMVGLESDGAMRVSQYSKGMKNRLSIARALVNTPDLFFLDEPTAGLDPVNAQRIKDLIREQRDAGRTVFLTTHDMSVAEELCDRVAFIIDGSIATIDAPGSLKLKYGERAVRVEHGDGHDDFGLDGLADNAGFQDVLRRSDLRTIHSREASLADVFIAVTGRGLE